MIAKNLFKTWEKMNLRKWNDISSTSIMTSDDRISYVERK